MIVGNDFVVADTVPWCSEKNATGFNLAVGCKNAFFEVVVLDVSMMDAGSVGVVGESEIHADHAHRREYKGLIGIGIQLGLQSQRCICHQIR